MSNSNNETIQIDLTVQTLINKGYTFKIVNNTIEVIDNNGCSNYYVNNDFKKWIFSASI